MLSAGRDRTYAIDTGEGVRSVTQPRGMASKYAVLLRQVVDDNYAVRPRDGRVLLIAAPSIAGDTPPDGFPTDGAIRAKVSAVKTAIHT